MRTSRGSKGIGLLNVSDPSGNGKEVKGRIKQQKAKSLVAAQGAKELGSWSEVG